MAFDPRSTDDRYPHPLFWKSSLITFDGNIAAIPNLSFSGEKILRDNGLLKSTVLLGHFLILNRDTDAFSAFLSELINPDDTRTVVQNISLWCDHCL